MKRSSIFTQSKREPGKLDGWSIILPVSFDLICGILLILLRTLALRVTTYAMAGVMIVFAGWLVITYFRSAPMDRITHSYLAIGLSLMVAGIMLALHPDYLNNFLPFIWGLALLFGAFLKVQYAFDEKTVKVEKWWIMLILAAFSLAIGTICLADPAFLRARRELIIGIMLIVEAIIDIVVFFVISKALKVLDISPSVSIPVEEKTAALESGAPHALPESVSDSESAPD